MPRISRALTALEYQALVNAMPKYCPTATFVVAGKTFTTPQAVALLTSVIDTTNAVAPARATWIAATKAVAAVEATDGMTARKIRDIVAIMLENEPTALAELAIEPPKPRKPLSNEARALAEAKARATRLARGTKSPKQKALIKGDVTGVTIVPLVGANTTPGGGATGHGAA
jgi:hypothetical protein